MSSNPFFYVSITSVDFQTSMYEYMKQEGFKALANLNDSVKEITTSVDRPAIVTDVTNIEIEYQGEASFMEGGKMYGVKLTRTDICS